MKALLQIFFFFLPWKLRRILLIKICGFTIHKDARIGFSIILAKSVKLEEHSYIGNLTFCRKIDLLHIKKYGILGNLNFITGFPSGDNSHFGHVIDRKSVLAIGNHSAVTARHFIDCTAGVFIGDFTTFAGIRSQILTHSIDLKKNRQDAASVVIGDYCFVGTGCTVLKGSKLPDFSVLGAASLLNKNFEEQKCLYGGVPAKRIISLDIDEDLYFSRKEGYVI